MRVLLCSEALGTSSSLAVGSIGRVSWFLVGAVVPQLWQENLLCFCRVRRLLTYYLHIVPELIVSAINNLKTMDGGHAVHER